MIYLKINRDIDYAWFSLKFWIDVALALNSNYIIICDNDDFKKRLLDKFSFLKEETFIKSYTNEATCISKKIAISRWEKASNAHLTTFLHAKENSVEKFWNIDADDTAFGLSPTKTANLMKTAEKYADDNSLDLFGLDMWWTIHRGDNWTFGITFTSNKNNNLCDVILQHYLDDAYLKEKNHYNIDCFFNYLRKKEYLNIESFYFQNTYFIHWGAPFGPYVYRFRTNDVVYSRKFLYLFTRTLMFGKHRIMNEVIKIQNFSENDDKKYIRFLKKSSSFFNISPFVFILKTKGIKGLLNLIKNRK